MRDAIREIVWSMAFVPAVPNETLRRLTSRDHRFSFAVLYISAVKSDSIVPIVVAVAHP